MLLLELPGTAAAGSSSRSGSSSRGTAAAAVSPATWYLAPLFIPEYLIVKIPGTWYCWCSWLFEHGQQYIKHKEAQAS